MAEIVWNSHPVGGEVSSDRKWRVALIGGLWTLQQLGVEGWATSRTEDGIKGIAQTLADGGQTVDDYMKSQLAKGN
jgi:hypothetical protein